MANINNTQGDDDDDISAKELSMKLVKELIDSSESKNQILNYLAECDEVAQGPNWPPAIRADLLPY